VFTPCTRTTAGVLGSFIDALTWDDALERIGAWARQRESRYVCACSVHSLVTASIDPAFQKIINSADMAIPDGMPVAWSLRKLGFPNQRRISGPDLMWRLCEGATASGQKVFFYGSSPRTLAQLRGKLIALLPGLKIVGMNSPPYHPHSQTEDRAIIELINSSEAAIVFVGLGCPKQERWMAQQRGEIRAVMIGVGAAFDYHAATLKRAPPWMQQRGLEWLYRLMKEPRRLWRRYLFCNTVFLFRIAQQLMEHRTRAISAVQTHAAAPLKPSAAAPSLFSSSADGCQSDDLSAAREPEEHSR
jgi:N-acetylglucosaminyldiphosphoundecaprenol N-acetyl-beta-D-mannosaminyltransferase